jgi:hypothetical protein
MVLAVLTCVATIFWVQATIAQNNDPPPPGAILDLNGTPIPGGGDGVTYQQYSVTFTGSLTNTDVTFAFREDPAFISFTDLLMVDLTTSSGQLFTNGDFTGGTHCSRGNCLTPVGWEYANVFGATFGGVIRNNCAPAPSGNTNCWYDGAVQAYDAIDQHVPTTIGDQYQISFFLADNSFCRTDGGPPCNFMDISNNGQPGTGGNGIDALVYAQAGLPTPEPGSLLLLGSGIVGLVGIARRKLGL